MNNGEGLGLSIHVECACGKWPIVKAELAGRCSVASDRELSRLRSQAPTRQSAPFTAHPRLAGIPPRPEAETPAS